MKTRMKKLISIKSMTALSLALLIVLGTAMAESEGDSVTGSGLVTANLATGIGDGTAILSIEGERVEGIVEVNVFPNPDGTFWVIHKFDFGEDNTLSTEGTEVMKSADDPGLLVLSGDMNVTEGTGYFDGASGELNVHGKVQITEFPLAIVSFKVNGTICR